MAEQKLKLWVDRDTDPTLPPSASEELITLGFGDISLGANWDL